MSFVMGNESEYIRETCSLVKRLDICQTTIYRKKTNNNDTIHKKHLCTCIYPQRICFAYCQQDLSSAGQNSHINGNSAEYD